MKMNKICTLFLLLAAFFVFSGCQAADLVAKVAVTSFDTLMKTIPDKVTLDGEKGGWAVNGMDGKERAILSKDFSSSNPDIAVEFDAAPFVNAGLDATKLPAGQFTYDAATGTMTMNYEYGQDKFSADAGKSVLNTFKEIVKTHRSIIGYHQEGDHYKIALGNGNSLAWAKDMSSNKADLAFILNPKPFMDAGVDASKIKEWVFTKMPMMDKDGKSIEVEVFMKAFNVQ